MYHETFNLSRLFFLISIATWGSVAFPVWERASCYKLGAVRQCTTAETGEMAQVFWGLPQLRKSSNHPVVWVLKLSFSFFLGQTDPIRPKIDPIWWPLKEVQKWQIPTQFKKDQLSLRFGHEIPDSVMMGVAQSPQIEVFRRCQIKYPMNHGIKENIIRTGCSCMVNM